MNRREFISSCGAFALAGRVLGEENASGDRYGILQAEIDQVHKSDFKAYQEAFHPGMTQAFPALRRLEAVFGNVLNDVRQTKVTDRPAVWFLYNMGLIVKTAETCFSIDLMHRRGEEFAPYLDFALITHNHLDHYTESFYLAMNGAGKTIISNFKDNYGVKDWRRDGGYARGEKTIRLKDVEIATSLTDHNDYLVDFTSAFEIKTHGFTLYHTGDASNLGKLNPSTAPDLWCVHPRCGIDPVEAVMKFRPKRTAVLHLNEMGHEVNRWRWTWQDGLTVAQKIKEKGLDVIVPTWGVRLV